MRTNTTSSSPLPAEWEYWLLLQHIKNSNSEQKTNGGLHFYCLILQNIFKYCHCTMASINRDPRVVKTREINWCNKIIATFQKILQTFNCHIIGTTKNFFILENFFFCPNWSRCTFLFWQDIRIITYPNPLKIVF